MNTIAQKASVDNHLIINTLKERQTGLEPATLSLGSYFL